MKPMSREIEQLLDQIEETSLALAELRRAAGHNCDARSEIEDLHTLAILNARGEDNKPTYSNDQRREIELRSRLKVDRRWQELSREIEEQEMLKARLEVRLDRLRSTRSLRLLELRSDVLRREESLAV